MLFNWLKLNEISKKIGNKVAELLHEHKVTKYWLAKKTGISEPTLGRNIKGKGNWLPEQLDSIAKVFNKSLDWFFERESALKIVDTSNRNIDVPLYGMAICGLPSTEWSDPKGFITVDFVKGLDHVFAVKATGLSMSQTIMPDDIIFAYRSPTKPKSGSIVLASLKAVPDTKEGLIKRVKWLPKKQIMLYSDNARNYEPMIVDESDVYEIFSVHNQIIRQIRQPGQKLLV